MSDERKGPTVGGIFLRGAAIGAGMAVGGPIAAIVIALATSGDGDGVDIS